MSAAMLALDMLGRTTFDDTVIVVVGPSGSGKTHFVTNYLLRSGKAYRYLEPNELAANARRNANRKLGTERWQSSRTLAPKCMQPILAIDEVPSWDRNSLVDLLDARVGNPRMTTILIAQTLVCLDGIYDVRRKPHIITIDRNRNEDCHTSVTLSSLKRN